jgi:hypothetical protein
MWWDIQDRRGIFQESLRFLHKEGRFTMKPSLFVFQLPVAEKVDVSVMVSYSFPLFCTS